ncbi:MAG TPA: Ig-like domain-containing protein, partial [Acidimicrobiia bacterium]|nr:Ig-like domain-containing protein [Acidimicrobiia bacterium]
MSTAFQEKRRERPTTPGSASAATEAQFDQIWLKPVRRGEQAIQAQDYDWTALYAMLYANDAAYAEVYLHSFSLARKALLATEIQKFAASRCVSAPPVDTTPPTVAVGAPAPGARLNGTLGVAISASDDQGSVTRVELVLDGAPAGSAAGAPATIAWDTTTVADGGHALVARATDGAGNVGVSAAVAVTVDNTAPEVPQGLSATPGDAGVTVTFDAVTAPDLAGYDVRSKPSSSAVWDAPTAVASTSTTVDGLVNGTAYDFSVRSRDDLGNASPWSASLSATPVAPDVPTPVVAITAPANGTRLAGTAPVAIAASGGRAIVEVGLRLDDAVVGSSAAAPATIPWDTTTVADGAHGLSAWAVDDAGTIGTSPTVPVTVDNTAPPVPSGLAASPGDGQVIVTFQAVDAADLAGYDVRVKESSSTVWGAAVAAPSTSAAFVGLVDGTSYDFAVRSRDTLGNPSPWSAPVSATPFVPDTTAPVVTISAPSDGARVAGTVAVSIQASDAGSVSRIDLLIDSQPVGAAAVASATIMWDTTTLAGGSHVLSASAVDAAGNVGMSAPLSVTVDNDAPPVPGGLNATSGDRQITVTFQAVSAADLAGYDVRLKPSSSTTWGAPVAAASTTATFSGLTNGTSYDLSARSRDT